ncbi:DUF481 domain-containing protein [Novosphingobium sp. PhB165]|uniref:DUF481 domain-containing protein n=1 Tax=Novosphingobium sp. PhB165 TaxID=2485105 RepID=UPI001FB28B12|nr:DUF481 domain-containing protein [Novosphingobium sp. PhB165]
MPVAPGNPAEAAPVIVPVEPLALALPAYPWPTPFVPCGPPRLPENVRAMLESAIRTGDSATVAAVVRVALDTEPYDKDEIRAMKKSYDDEAARQLAAKANAETQRIRQSAILELWTGKVELGAFRATGNTSNFGFSGALNLDRKGIDWQHTVQLTADYQKDSGTVTREQYLASYQARYTLNDGLFTFGRTQWESNEIQGFRDRYSLSGGLGYRVIKRSDLALSVEVGPAVRRTRFVVDPSETTWSTLTSLDFSWKVDNTLKLTQTASSYIETGNSTFTTNTGIEAGMSKSLKAKLSYSFSHESSPPDGTLRTDTISRFSLVYGF